MKNDKRFSFIALLIVIILVVGGIIYFSYTKQTKPDSDNGASDNLSAPQVPSNNVENVPSVSPSASDQDSQQTSNEEPICNVGYDKTDESKVVSENSYTLITGFEKKCDGNYYFTFDYLSIKQGEPEEGGGFTNTNSKLRTFKMDPSLKVKLTNNSNISLKEYIATLEKSNTAIFNQSNVYMRNDPAGQPVFYITIQDGVVNLMNEVYLP
jgi:hypothetical protein